MPESSTGYNQYFCPEDNCPWQEEGLSSGSVGLSKMGLRSWWELAASEVSIHGALPSLMGLWRKESLQSHRLSSQA